MGLFGGDKKTNITAPETTITDNSVLDQRATGSGLVVRGGSGNSQSIKIDQRITGVPGETVYQLLTGIEAEHNNTLRQFQQGVTSLQSQQQQNAAAQAAALAQIAEAGTASVTGGERLVKELVPLLLLVLAGVFGLMFFGGKK